MIAAAEPERNIMAEPPGSSYQLPPLDAHEASCLANALWTGAQALRVADGGRIRIACDGNDIACLVESAFSLAKKPEQAVTDAE